MREQKPLPIAQSNHKPDFHSARMSALAWYNSKPPKYMKMWDVIYLLPLIFQAATGCFVIAGYFFARRQFRLVRTSSYTERYTSAAFQSIRVAVDEDLYTAWGKTLPERIEHYRKLLWDDTKEGLTLRHQYWTMAMIFTEIGLAYKSGAIDNVAIESLNRILPRYWHRMKPYIYSMHQRFGYPIRKIEIKTTCIKRAVLKDSEFRKFLKEKLRVECDTQIIGHLPIEIVSGHLDLESQELYVFNNFRRGYLKLRINGKAVEPVDLLAGNPNPYVPECSIPTSVPEAAQELDYGTVEGGGASQ